ncbi:MAG TPA: hypothetical protein P5110_08025 [Candidatus Omnitrophota bacterium]|nr:hypothetical protein [Candidatus Omnitrophota bacterium]
MVSDMLKNRLVIILGLCNVIFLLVAFSSCNNALKYRAVRDKEAALRLEAEEKINVTERDKTTAEDKATKISQDLEKERSGRQAAEGALMQEKMINDSLRKELEKLTKLKDALEEDLKQALVTGKVEKSKK